MSVLEAIVLGIIQGAFMFVPVSSTSHLALAQHWLIERGSALPPPESPEMILFNLVVHVGTLVSILLVFHQSVRQFLGLLVQSAARLLSGQSKHLSKKEAVMADSVAPNYLWPFYLRIGVLGGVSVFVTALMGFTLKSQFELVFATPLAMSFTLAITGGLLWLSDVLKHQKRTLQNFSPWGASVVGFAQGLALIPGLSRSGLTISFALFTGLQRPHAAEFSFLIAFPTILGATLVQGISVLGQGSLMGTNWLTMLVGFWTAALVGAIALKLVLIVFYQARMRYFAYYVWALAIIVAWQVLRGAAA